MQFLQFQQHPPVRMRSSSALKVTMGQGAPPLAFAFSAVCSSATSSISWGLKCG